MAKTYETLFKLTATETSAFKAAFSHAGKTLRETESQAKALQRAMNQLHKAYAKGDVDAVNYEKSIDRIAKAYDRQKRAAVELAKVSKINQLQANVNSLHDSAGGMAMKAVAMAVGTTGFPVREAMQFEDVMADVRKVVDFDTPEQFKQMGEDIMHLSERIPMASTEIAKLVAAGGQAGIARKDLLAFAEDAGKMGVAFDMSAEEAGQTMAEWRTAFKMTQPQVVQLADKVNYLSNTTAASSSKISDIVSRVGPLGSVGGMAAAQIAAIGAAMAAAGTESDVAATGIQKIILGLTAGEGATKTQQEAFQELGLDATEMAKRMQTDAGGALQDVFTRLSKIDKYRQTAVLQNLFGSEGIKAIAPLLTNLDQLNENMAAVNDQTKYGNSMGKEFEARMATTSNSMQLAKNAAHNLAITVGNNLLPTVKSFFDWLAPGVQGLSVWANEHKQLTSAIVMGVGGLVLGTAAISGMIWAVTGLLSPILTVVKAYRAWRAAQIIATGATNAGTLSLLRQSIAAKAHAVASGVSAAATRIAAGAQRLWNGALVVGRGLMSVGRIVAYRIAVVATDAATRTAAIGQGMLNASMAVGRGLLSVGRIIAYRAAMIAARGVTTLWTTAQWLLNAALLANPIGLVIAGITGLIAVGYLLITNWDKVKVWFSLLWNDPKAALAQFTEYIRNQFGGALDWARGKWEELKNFLSDPIKGTVEIVKNVISGGGGGTEKGLYTGGIFPKGAFLTWFAEKSPEAAIPLDGSSNAISLWKRAGQMLGVLPGNSEQQKMDQAPALKSTGLEKMAPKQDVIGAPKTIPGTAPAQPRQHKSQAQTIRERLIQTVASRFGINIPGRVRQPRRSTAERRASLWERMGLKSPQSASTNAQGITVQQHVNVSATGENRPRVISTSLIPQRDAMPTPKVPTPNLVPAQRQPSQQQGQGDNVTINLNVTVNGHVDEKEARSLGARLRDEVNKIMDERERRKRRVSFA